MGCGRPAPSAVWYNSPIAPPFEHVLAAARDRAPWALDCLYRHLAPPVAGYLRLRGAAEPEDMTSDVFVRVFSRIGAFAGDEAGFRSWVFTIAHHLLVDEGRRDGRRPRLVALEAAADAGAPADTAADALGRVGEAGLHRVLDLLSPDQRDVLLLRLVADLAVEEVAVALGKTPGAVKALQHRGLAAVRRTLAIEAVSL
ncbi:MAG: RNA polymerase sigma factor [Acidimicrobiales bacterium]